MQQTTKSRTVARITVIDASLRLKLLATGGCTRLTAEEVSAKYQIKAQTGR